MAFSHIQGAQSTENSTPVTTKSVTLSAIGNGNCVLGAINYDLTGSVTVTSIDDDKGNTYNLEGPVDDSPDGGRSYAFSRTNITNAPTVITAHLSASIGFVGIAADEFSGSSTTSSDERDGTAHGGQFQATPGTGTDAVTSGNFTTSTNGDLLYGVSFNNGAGNNPASGTGFTAGVAGSFPAYGFLSEYKTQATAGSGTATTFTAATNTGHTTFLIAIKPSGAAVTPTALFNKWWEGSFETENVSYG